MKRHILPTLLLIFVLLLSACTQVSTPPSTDTGTQTDEPTAPQSPKSIVGIWHSVTDQCVLDIQSHEQMSYYELKVGYYQYTKKTDLSATYEDEILTISLTEGSYLSWEFDSSDGSLISLDSDAEYTKKDTLPTAYITHPFPDYAALNCETLVTLESLDTLILSPANSAQAAKDIFDVFYKSTTEALPTVSGRAAALGDYVNINYKGYMDGVAFAGGEAANQKVLVMGGTGYIDGFAEGIAGHSVGETFEVEVTFPEVYPNNPDMAGKPAVFEMTLNAIYNTEIADAEIKEFTKDEYETYAAMLEAYSKDYAKQTVWQDVLSNATFGEIPEAAYNFFLQYASDYYHYYAQMYGVEYEQFLSMIGTTQEAMIAQAKGEAKTYIVAYALAKQHNLTVTEEAYQNRMEEFITQLMQENSITRAEAEGYAKEQELEIKTILTYELVTDWLIERAEQNGENS